MLLASATFALKCHDMETGEIVHNYTPPLKKNVYIKHLAWNKDGTWLALTPTEGSTFIISIKSSNIKQLHKITSIQAPTCSVFKHDTKKYLSLGTANGSVLTYDFKTENILKTYPKVDSGIFALYYCSNDSHLIAGCTNGEIIVFNANSKVKSSKFRIPNSKTLSCIKPHQRLRNLLAGGSQNGLVAIFDLNQSKLKYCNKFHNAPVKEISFLPNREDILFSIGMDKKIRFQDIKSNVSITEIDFKEVMTCMDVSYDSTNMIIGTENGNIHVYDIRNIRLPKLSIEKAHDAWIEKIAVQTCLTPETDKSLEAAAENTSSLSIIAEEVTQVDLNLNLPKLSTADSFIDEFGINESLNSPINTVLNKRRSSQKFRQKSNSECSEADSFLEALGFSNSPNPTQNKARNSLGPITEKVESLLQEKPGILILDSNNSPVLKTRQKQSLLLEKVQKISLELLETPPKDLENENLPTSSDKLEKQLTSTPKITINCEDSENIKSEQFFVGDIKKMVKDVISGESGGGKEAIRKEIKQIVTEEMSLLKEELKEVVKGAISEQTVLLLENQKMHMWRLMEFHRQIEAEKHLYRVKESMKIEEAFIDLANIITGDLFEGEMNTNLLDLHNN